jgi:FtsP/CotA-like multicopper oxidase with cupredoxin domain
MGWDDITEYQSWEHRSVELFNLSADVHPIHLHLVHSQILDHQQLLPDPSVTGVLAGDRTGLQGRATRTQRDGWEGHVHVNAGTGHPDYCEVR